ncbi:MAG TPA: hypothetical protein VH395_17355 [Jatrophihabitantaceae bacterium]|jgi:uncharacterized membrane protein YeaQ/YmgE (transglycosylase-associated protein family)
MFLTLFIILVVLFVVLPLIGMSAWGLISTVIVGLIIGFLGRLIVPGSQRLGFVYTLMAGLAGSILGGFLGDHVLDLGWFPTVLIEIGVAAAAVALLGAVRRGQLPGAPRRA